MECLFLRRPLAGEAVLFGAAFLLVFDSTTRLRRGVLVFDAAIALFDLRLLLPFVFLEGMAAVYHQCIRTAPMPSDLTLNIAQSPAARRVHMVNPMRHCVLPLILRVQASASFSRVSLPAPRFPNRADRHRRRHFGVVGL